MLERLKTILQPTSEDPEIAHRQYILNIVLLGLAGPGFLFGLIMAIIWLLGPNQAAAIGAISGLGVQIFYLLAYWLGRHEKVTIAGYIPTMSIFLIMAGGSFFLGIGHVTIIGFAMVISTAGVLIGLSASVLFSLLSVVAYFLAGTAQVNGLITAVHPTQSIALDSIGLGLGLVVVVVMNWLAMREMENALTRERSTAKELQKHSSGLEELIQSRTQDLQRRALQLQTTAEIAKLTNEIRDPDKIIARTVDMIRERFGYYYASVFTMDSSGNWAELAASTGEVGQRMLARGHRLGVGSASIVGWATGNRLPRVANDVTQDPFHFANPLLPDTRSEMAVPLLVGDELLGALDVQSTELNAFSEADVHTMEAIAEELAASIDSATTQREMMEELERLENVTRYQTRESWQRLSKSDLSHVIHLSPTGEITPLIDEDFPSIRIATETGKPARTDDNREVAVPIIVRGEIVATIAARKPYAEEAWADEEVAFFEAVAGQAALSMENARQRAEEHRRMSELEVLNRVSQAVSQMIQLDTLYRVVHRQIRQILGDTDMSVAIFNPENQTVSFPYTSERGDVVDHPSVPLGEGLTSTVIRSRQPLLLVEDTERIASALGASQVGSPAKSWLGVPMMIGDEVIGVITVQDLEYEYRYTEDDVALLSTIASQVAAAIQNERLLGQVQRAARRERLTREIASKVRRAPDMRNILQTTARELSQALHAAKITVSLGESKESDLPDEFSESGDDPELNDTDESPEEFVL
jgi:GAF domain-containing protein